MDTAADLKQGILYSNIFIIHKDISEKQLTNLASDIGTTSQKLNL